MRIKTMGYVREKERENELYLQRVDILLENKK
jgi:hypothetical protein